MLALWWCSGKWKKDSSSALHSISSLSCLFPWGSRKNEPQTVSDSGWTLCWCRGLHFHLNKGMVNPLLIEVPPWQSFMVITPGHVQQQSASNLSLFPYLYSCYIGIKSPLRRGTLYSPTALMKMTAWGQVSGRLFHPVLHGISTDLLQWTYEQKAIWELMLVGSQLWGDCTGPQSRQVTFLLTRRDFFVTMVIFQYFCGNGSMVYKIKGGNCTGRETVIQTLN